eukprot:CAMPEP_0174305456 /NCGR_PEP_ID=MMETSP0809-20121228/61423_1 /TAXON_ID=73025 ORGANISM="Eutreptiella gymnastica-like, Strain CCMP1594" /NCGR_SAMPLE_ID=MMETSP0809 /ASSEMBLY_ACC=CAM_ASM_000658 /LENGTH=73 /DNA_ID=CAMNT_0015411941 /DNA_START=1017 /DNA_END=1238 /DNA_ORIENTATION=-
MRPQAAEHRALTCLGKPNKHGILVQMHGIFEADGLMEEAFLGRGWEPLFGSRSTDTVAIAKPQVHCMTGRVNE